MNDWTLLAAFQDADAAIRAGRELQRLNYAPADAYTPYRVPELERLLVEPRPRLRGITFLAGAGGAALALAVQWLTNAHWYPLDAGGRPPFALPAFALIAFETAALTGAAAAFIGLLWGARLPRLARPLFEVEGFERASVDEFWLAVPLHGTRLGEPLLRSTLEREGASRMVTVTGRHSTL